MNMKFLDVLLPMMFDGLKLTILIAVVGIGIGFLIGSLCGYLLQSKYKIGKAIAEVYIWIITADGAGTLRVLRYSEIVLSGHQQYNRRNRSYCIKLRSIYLRDCQRSADGN